MSDVTMSNSKVESEFTYDISRRKPVTVKNRWKAEVLRKSRFRMVARVVHRRKVPVHRQIGLGQ
jgi:hypothetical protein